MLNNLPMASQLANIGARVFEDKYWSISRRKTTDSETALSANNVQIHGGEVFWRQLLNQRQYWNTEIWKFKSMNYELAIEMQKERKIQETMYRKINRLRAGCIFG